MICKKRGVQIPDFLKDTADESRVAALQNPKSRHHHRMVRLIEQSPPAWAKFFI